MPNWCSNSFYFYSKKKNKADVLEFYLDMKNALSDRDREDKDWVGRLFIGAGFTQKELDGLPLRGYVTNLSLIGQLEGVEIESETAWVPNDDAMQKLIDTKYPNLSMVFMAEECGCEIYINSDTEGIRYKTRYMIDWTVDGDDWETKYYEKEEDMIKDLSAILKLPNETVWSYYHGVKSKIDDRFEEIYSEDASLCLNEYTTESYRGGKK